MSSTPVDLGIAGWDCWQAEWGWHYAERREPYARVIDRTQAGVRRRIVELEYYEAPAPRRDQVG